MNIFGLNPVVVFGTEEQKRRFLPPLIRGEEKACFAVTEPDAGLDTTRSRPAPCATATTTSSHGQKIWTSTAQVADQLLLLARTTPEEVKKPTDGLSLFYTDARPQHVDVRVIHKMGRKAVDSNELFIDGLPVPVEDRIGEEGHGFEYMLHGMNPERILIAAEAVGLGRAALDARRPLRQGARRVRPAHRPEPGDPASARRVLGRSRGRQPDDAARPPRLYDAGEPCGVGANAAKYLGAEAGFEACETAVMTHGGMGYAKEFHVERLLREVMIARIAPVSRELILCHIAEKALGLPKSY